MLQHGLDPNPPLDVAIQHFANQINAVLAENVRHPKVVVHDLVDAIEGILLVDDGVEEDAQSPDVLFFAAIGEAAEDFGGGVIWKRASVYSGREVRRDEKSVPIVPTKTSNGPDLMYAALPKSASLTFPSPSRMMFSSLMSRCTTFASMWR
jgi:hypothetical protein